MHSNQHLVWFVHVKNGWRLRWWRRRRGAVASRGWKGDRGRSGRGRGLVRRNLLRVGCGGGFGSRSLCWFVGRLTIESLVSVFRFFLHMLLLEFHVTHVYDVKLEEET
jgi:hypothetical protein